MRRLRLQIDCLRRIVMVITVSALVTTNGVSCVVAADLSAPSVPELIQRLKAAQTHFPPFRLTVEARGRARRVSEGGESSEWSRSLDTLEYAYDGDQRMARVTKSWPVKFFDAADSEFAKFVKNHPPQRIGVEAWIGTTRIAAYSYGVPGSSGGSLSIDPRAGNDTSLVRRLHMICPIDTGDRRAIHEILAEDSHGLRLRPHRQLVGDSLCHVLKGETLWGELSVWIDPERSDIPMKVEMTKLAHHKSWDGRILGEDKQIGRHVDRGRHRVENSTRITELVELRDRWLWKCWSGSSLTEHKDGSIMHGSGVYKTTHVDTLENWEEFFDDTMAFLPKGISVELTERRRLEWNSNGEVTREE